MTRALVSALSGLRAHQGWIDVIGNNLANTNTPAYKTARAVFSTLISRTLREGSPPTDSLGGTDPMQVGLGAQLAMVDRDLGQGALDITGRTFDLAMLGEGYFTLFDGNRDVFSRVGSFSLDSKDNLVDQRTGYRVLNPNGQAIKIDSTGVVPPKTTSAMQFEGNLPSEITGPLAETLSSASAIYEGTAASITGGATGPFTLPAGEAYTMELAINGGAPQLVSISVPASGVVTAQDVADEVNKLDHITATVNADQSLSMVSDKTGEKSTIKVTPGAAGKDLAGAVGLSTTLVAGTETLAGLSSNLNLLTLNDADYLNGDTLEISGTEADGSIVQATFVYGTDGTTMQDLVDFVNAQFSSAEASFDASAGKLVFSAEESGESDLSLVISDGNGQVGQSQWATAAFAVTTNGAGPDTVTTSMEVFDPAGGSHILSFDYVRQDDNSWTMTASLPSSSGTVTAGTVSNIRFNENGSLQTPPSADITIQFNGGSSQNIKLTFGEAGSFDGITQFGSATNLVASGQNGYGAGTLASISVGTDGAIEGFYTNGQSVDLGAIGVTTFTNPRGLEELGNSYWGETSNSGQRLTAAGAGNGAGEVIGGALEQSNVDSAAEFVRLIQAQRGFQANARIISVQDQLLEEVVNVV
ncbi:flagellar hook-basal body complex protein [Engelhardtia mirabilis]|uniref:Flagellar hook protein FlgE n=1 Tax=Engelhardtia mirabilis TaxID=2528011 RepID=A0A518BSX9_9BACT|nr:Flagellar hook protein FlgE [Planctomycetes bacterium Pla133]QDV04411.1 Flagellar hook protein FlgE [Planctomycetes bacterium Pla86]